MTSNLNSNARLALVTGASTGIGYDLAIEFAKAGFDLVIVADNDAIHEAKVALEKMGRNVIAIQTDLASKKGVEEVANAVKNSQLYALAFNAGVGASGHFLDGTNIETDLNLINLNVVSVVHLAKLLLPKLVESGEGRVLVTSSVAALTPGPFNAVYHASKAFIQSFVEAIREELKDSGVTITSLMPGATNTQFFARAHMLDTKVGQGKKDDSALVAKQGFEAMMRGHDQVIAGSLMNKVQGVISRVTPDVLKAKQMRTENEPLAPGDEASVDAITMLKQQHREAEALFKRIESADGGERAAIFNTLATKLLEHMAIEEDIFYKAAAKIDKPGVRHSEGEHEAAKSVIQKILSLKESDGTFLALVEDLKHKISHHVKEEEYKLFPECEKAMQKGDLIDLADDMRDLMIDLDAQGAMWVRKSAS